VDGRPSWDPIPEYAWLAELISPEPGVRAAALARHRALATAEPPPGELSGTFADLLEAFVHWDEVPTARSPDQHARLASYAVLFLRWESAFPDECDGGGWRGGPWGFKGSVLRTFAVRGPVASTGPALEDLVLAAVHRRQHCHDPEYVRLARRLDGPGLRARLRAAATENDEQTRLRAGYLLWLLDHPDARIRSSKWRQWVRTVARPLMEPRPAADLAAMPPADAVALLAGRSPASLTAVLNGLEAGPAARILTAAMSSATAAAVMAEAVAAMDADLAARLLRVTPGPVAAELLSAMKPAVAARRFPGHTDSDVLVHMDTEVAVARLSRMPPVIAGRRLEYLPAARKADLLARMDAAAAAHALEGMGWWTSAETLLAMPPDVALGLLERMLPWERERALEEAERLRFRSVLGPARGYGSR
jgi:hypothetical protein